MQYNYPADDPGVYLLCFTNQPPNTALLDFTVDTAPVHGESAVMHATDGEWGF